MPRSHATRLVALVTSILTVATGLIASSPAHAKPVRPTVTITTLPAQVRLIPGEVVDVRLETNLTTGYTWGTRVTGDSAAVTVAKGVYTAPTTPPGFVGAPGTTAWRVTATAQGTAVVKFFTTPPGGGARQRVGSLTVIVGR